ncbi:MAG: hypothetical protein K0M50_04985 [Prolixibacteraceae bacterium]|nr:hypothetical protein [Prolixibacteraceae bacterium]
MGITSKQFRLVFFLTIFSIAAYSASPIVEKTRNILVINSYEQGFAWTDSLMTGILKEAKVHPEIMLSIENLNSKRFGQNHFETFKHYFQEKYVGVHFDGILVTDNDALDFAFTYDQDLFPDAPVVFTGISNPEVYPLDGSKYWGIKETSNTDSIIDLVKLLLPESKKMLVLTDLTTTGRIYREGLMKQRVRFPDFSILFPEEIVIDSIESLVSSNRGIDAVFYIGINQDKFGNPVNNVLLLESVGKLTKVPLFTNDPLFIGKQVVGGIFQSGVKHGQEAVRLLYQLLDSTHSGSIPRIQTTEQGYFFDRTLLSKFNINEAKLPKGSILADLPGPFNKSFLGVLGIAFLLLSLAVLILSVVNRRRRNRQKRSDSQLKEIEAQKNELKEAYSQLNEVISELENANELLKDSNVSLLEAKKKAEEADNLKSAFLANVSHEIRTPLNSIVGFSSLLIEPDLDEETRKTYADLIESNTESLLVLIDEIIDLSKIEAQQLTLKKIDFSIDALLEELLQVFSYSHKNEKVALRVSKISEQKELFVFSDRVRVKQIFINLLTNALKFTDSGFIELGYLMSESKELVLYVKDTGIGIKKEHHTEIFRRFRKLNENALKIYRGTGLGLAITQKLVELLGGKIWIVSEPGQGATFCFTLENCVLKDSH